MGVDANQRLAPGVICSSVQRGDHHRAQPLPRGGDTHDRRLRLPRETQGNGEHAFTSVDISILVSFNFQPLSTKPNHHTCSPQCRSGPATGGCVFCPAAGGKLRSDLTKRAAVIFGCDVFPGSSSSWRNQILRPIAPARPIINTTLIE